MHKKTIWTIIVIVIIIIAAVWALTSGNNAPVEDNNTDENATSTATTTQPVDDAEATSTDSEGTENLGDDATSSIEDQLEGINVDDVEDELNNIDEDLQNL